MIREETTIGMGTAKRKSLNLLLAVLFLLPAVVCLGDDPEEMTPEEKKEHQKAVKALFKLAHHRKDMIRSYALAAIGQLGTDEAVERLEEALFKDSNSGAKTYVATGLGNTGRPDVIPILKKAMAKSNSLQVKTACSAAINSILNSR